MTHHDRSYKLLFSHPQMVRDLLQGFVCKDWLAGLHYTSLERVSGDSVSDKLRARSNDLVWRMRRGSEWVHLYLLLEFQSTVERYMAARALTYSGHLYQDLIRRRELPENGLLPEVLPIVLYNGERPWRASRCLGPLIERGACSLKHYRPHARYFLIDVRRVRTKVKGVKKSRRHCVSDREQRDGRRTPYDCRLAARITRRPASRRTAARVLGLDQCSYTASSSGHNRRTHRRSRGDIQHAVRDDQEVEGRLAARRTAGGTS